MKARFYGVKCDADIINGVPTITGHGFFNKCALNFMARVHQVRSFIAGRPLPLVVTFSEDE